MDSINLKPLRFLIFLLGILPILVSFVPKKGIPCYNCERKLVVKTSMTYYTKGDSIEITLINRLKQSIWSHAGSETPIFAIQHVEIMNLSHTWDTLYIRCQYPECEEESDAPQEILPGASVIFSWNPQIYPDGSQEHHTAEAGRYRLVIMYMFADKKEWKQTYSNEFVIK